MYVSVVLSLQDHMDQTGILVWQWEARETVWGSLFYMALRERASYPPLSQLSCQM